MTRRLKISREASGMSAHTSGFDATFAQAAVPRDAGGATRFVRPQDVTERVGPSMSGITRYDLVPIARLERGEPSRARVVTRRSCDVMCASALPFSRPCRHVWPLGATRNAHCHSLRSGSERSAQVEGHVSWRVHLGTPCLRRLWCPRGARRRRGYRADRRRSRRPLRATRVGSRCHCNVR